MGHDPFVVLDAEVLDQVVGRLDAEDVAHLLCASTHLSSELSTGRHALQLWLRHCRDLLGPPAVAHIAASCKADQARTWLQLYASARMLDRLHWSPAIPAARTLELVDNTSSSSSGGADDLQAQRQLPLRNHDAAAVLARTGHTATAAGTHLVVVGGTMRDGPAPTALDIAVLDLPNSCIVKPAMYGQQPPALAEHCTAMLNPQPGSALYKQVAAAVADALKQRPLQPVKSSPATSSAQQAEQLMRTGYTLAVFGGLLPDGSEQPTAHAQLHILWLHLDASWGVWLIPDATGPAPAPRAYACCAGIHSGTQLLVYGGCVAGSMTGTVQADVGVFNGYLLMCIYLLDTATLTWSRVPTRPLDEPPKPGHVMLGPSTCPGPRKKALSCLRTNPVTGHEEFMLLGGCGVDGLADFVPYSLNLDTFYWIKGPVMGYLPPARGLCTVMRITPNWLVLLGGHGPRKQPLQDIQRLHLPTLSWRPPAKTLDGSSSTHGDRGSAQSVVDSAQHEQVPEHGCCATLGCAAEACVVLGGMQEGPYGRSIVPRMDMLLPGPVIPALQPNQHNTAAGLSAGAGALAGGLPVLLQKQFPFRHEDAQQHRAAWHAFATTSCRCGSCCSCLAAKAAASGALASCAQRLSRDGASVQRSSTDKGATGMGCVPRWQTVGGLPGEQLPGPTGLGSVNTSTSGSGKCMLSGPVGWSGELEIEPASATPQLFPPAAALGLAQRGQKLRLVQDGKGGIRQSGKCGELDAGSDCVWQTTSSSSDGRGLQVLLALFVVVMGLVLMAPSLMMHQ